MKPRPSTSLEPPSKRAKCKVSSYPGSGHNLQAHRGYLRLWAHAMFGPQPISGFPTKHDKIEEGALFTFGITRGKGKPCAASGLVKSQPALTPFPRPPVEGHHRLCFCSDGSTVQREMQKERGTAKDRAADDQGAALEHGGHYSSPPKSCPTRISKAFGNRLQLSSCWRLSTRLASTLLSLLIIASLKGSLESHWTRSILLPDPFRTNASLFRKFTRELI